MLFVDTSIIHYSSEGVLILCNILDLLIYSNNVKAALNKANVDFLCQEEEYSLDRILGN